MKKHNYKKILKLCNKFLTDNLYHRKRIIVYLKDLSNEKGQYWSFFQQEIHIFY